MDDPLHYESDPATWWTTVNTAEALPGVQTPLSWTWWADAIELGMRWCFYDLGVLSKSEIFSSKDAAERYSLVFYGRYTANITKMREVGDRMLGTDADGVEEQILGGLHSGLQSKNTLSRLPAIATRMPRVVAGVPKQLAAIRAETDAWWKVNTAPGVLTDGDGAPGRIVDAHERYIKVMRIHAAATMLCQAMYDQVVDLAAAAGLAGLENSLVTGYGDFEEGKIAEHLWDVSRGRMTVEQFVADHGYHGPHEGALSSRSWREDPTPIAKLAETYATMKDEADPAAVARKRVVEREAAEQKLLAATSALGRTKAKIILRMARRHIPLREIGKAAFLQTIDVGRAGAKTLGAHLAAAGQLDRAEDIQYVTYDEIAARDFDNLRPRVAERRAKRDHYLTIRLPDTWQGKPEEVALVQPGGEQVDEVKGIPVAPGVVEGRARVVTDPEVGIEIEPDEVLVCNTTDPSWASYFLVASALVIDIGGAMSHGAIVARELGVPCVINTRIGTSVINTGDLLRVDGAAGEVTILERA